VLAEWLEANGIDWKNLPMWEPIDVRPYGWINTPDEPFATGHRIIVREFMKPFTEWIHNNEIVVRRVEYRGEISPTPDVYLLLEFHNRACERNIADESVRYAVEQMRSEIVVLIDATLREVRDGRGLRADTQNHDNDRSVDGRTPDRDGDSGT
jgi:hypothetical protein